MYTISKIIIGITVVLIMIIIVLIVYDVTRDTSLKNPHCCGSMLLVFVFYTPSDNVQHMDRLMHQIDAFQKYKGDFLQFIELHNLHVRPPTLINIINNDTVQFRPVTAFREDVAFLNMSHQPLSDLNGDYSWIFLQSDIKPVQPMLRKTLVTRKYRRTCNMLDIVNILIGGTDTSIITSLRIPVILQSSLHNMIMFEDMRQFKKYIFDNATYLDNVVLAEHLLSTKDNSIFTIM